MGTTERPLSGSPLRRGDPWRGVRLESPLSLPESLSSPKKNHRSDRSGLLQQHDRDPEQDDEVRISLSTETLFLSRRDPKSRKGLGFNSRSQGQLYGLSSNGDFAIVKRLFPFLDDQSPAVFVEILLIVSIQFSPKRNNVVNQPFTGKSA